MMEELTPKKTIGIIAGNGRFPVLAAHECRKLGYRLVVTAIRGETEPVMEQLADELIWVKIGELKKMVKFFKKENVTEAVMAGKIEKVRLFQENVQPDFEMMKVVMKVRDFKDDSLLLGITGYLESQGVHLMDSTFFLKKAMPGAGVLGKKKPSKPIVEDIQFGFEIAKAIAALDLGQTVVVKKKAVLAVETIEGTDQAILRGGKLGCGKVTVVKVAKPNQDMRFDVPAVGLKTLKSLSDVQAEAFAFEAGKTIFLDLEEFVERADQKGIVLYGVES
ncbi:MAG: UDP-2,3-diacylglucosamine diphosphatase LpxI [Candidatus Omnitrophica bacterium]|nr:UDP-2,3-diacylglucosamine diphosphatase LpxI [Candidatus Omnitrophota bacterium]